VIVTPDLAPYRELKVRLLNGTHTAMTPLALLVGCSSVGDAVAHPEVGAFVRHVLFAELTPVLGVPGAGDYARDVLDRFANPFIRHALIDIMLQATMKMQVRLVPMLERHISVTGRVPEGLALGFAAHLYFVRAAMRGDGRASRTPADERGEAIRAIWAEESSESDAALTAAVKRICAEDSIWARDLHELTGFPERVASHLRMIHRTGVPQTLRCFLASPAAE
jgi:tagaturonate reductase